MARPSPAGDLGTKPRSGPVELPIGVVGRGSACEGPPPGPARSLPRALPRGDACGGAGVPSAGPKAAASPSRASDAVTMGRQGAAVAVSAEGTAIPLEHDLQGAGSGGRGRIRCMPYGWGGLSPRAAAISDAADWAGGGPESCSSTMTRSRCASAGATPGPTAQRVIEIRPPVPARPRDAPERIICLLGALAGTH